MGISNLRYDTAEVAVLVGTNVIPVINTAPTQTGFSPDTGASAALVTLSALATYLGTQPATFTSPMTLGSAGAAFVIQGTATAAGSNQASGAITHKANTGTGAGAVGGLIFQVPTLGSSGATAQTLANALVIDSTATTANRASFAGTEVLPSGIAGTSGVNTMNIRAFAVAAAPSLALTRINTSLAAPSIIGNAEGIGTIAFGGILTATTRVTSASIVATSTEQWVASTAAGTQLVFNVTPNTTATAVAALTLGQDKSALFTFSVKSSSPTGGLGYATGAGGAQTQLTDKATTVVSNTVTTAITLNNANLAAATIVAFTFTNSAIAATDTVVVTHQSAGTSGAYTFNAFPGAGSAVISLRNNTAGGLAEAIVLRVTVVKSVSA